ncbi:MAG: 50S ribosomal protein L27 [bacterium]
MAHKKAAGGGVRQHKNPTGKRLGIKKSAGQEVIPGNIILRQKGTVIKPGKGTMLSRDFTIFSVTTGKVNYKRSPFSKKNQKVVEVL